MKAGASKCRQFVPGKKKRKWEHYKAEWLADAFPLDEIGLTFFARCFRRHICVFVNSHYWTTHGSNDIEQCSIFLAYRGNMQHEQFKASSEAIGQMQAKFDEAKLREEGAMQHVAEGKGKSSPLMRKTLTSKNSWRMAKIPRN